LGDHPEAVKSVGYPDGQLQLKTVCLKVFHTYRMRHACYLSLVVVACVLVGMLAIFEIGEKISSELQESDPVEM